MAEPTVADINPFATEKDPAKGSLGQPLSGGESSPALVGENTAASIEPPSAGTASGQLPPQETATEGGSGGGAAAAPPQLDSLSPTPTATPAGPLDNSGERTEGEGGGGGGGGSAAGPGPGPGELPPSLSSPPESASAERRVEEVPVVASSKPVVVQPFETLVHMHFPQPLSAVLEEYNARARLPRGHAAMTEEELVAYIVELHKTQGGKCGTCAFPIRHPTRKSVGHKPALDYDSRTGFPRGLLCGRCEEWLRADGMVEAVLMTSVQAAQWAGAQTYLSSPPWNAVAGPLDRSPVYVVEVRVTTILNSTFTAPTALSVKGGGTLPASLTPTTRLPSNSTFTPPVGANNVTASDPSLSSSFSSTPLSSSSSSSSLALPSVSLSPSGGGGGGASSLVSVEPLRTSGIVAPDALPPLTKQDRANPTVLAARLRMLDSLAARLKDEIAWVSSLYTAATQGVWEELTPEARERLQGDGFAGVCAEQFERADLDVTGVLPLDEIVTLLRIVSALEGRPVAESPSKGDVKKMLEGFRFESALGVNKNEFVEFARLSFATKTAEVRRGLRGGPSGAQSPGREDVGRIGPGN